MKPLLILLALLFTSPSFADSIQVNGTLTVSGGAVTIYSAPSSTLLSQQTVTNNNQYAAGGEFVGQANYYPASTISLSELDFAVAVSYATGTCQGYVFSMATGSNINVTPVCTSTNSVSMSSQVAGTWQAYTFTGCSLTGGGGTKYALTEGCTNNYANINISTSNFGTTGIPGDNMRWGSSGTMVTENATSGTAIKIWSLQ